MDYPDLSIFQGKTFPYLCAINIKEDGKNIKIIRRCAGRLVLKDIIMMAGGLIAASDSASRILKRSRLSR